MKYEGQMVGGPEDGETYSATQPNLLIPEILSLSEADIFRPFAPIPQRVHVYRWDGKHWKYEGIQ